MLKLGLGIPSGRNFIWQVKGTAGPPRGCPAAPSEPGSVERKLGETDDGGLRGGILSVGRGNHGRVGDGRRKARRSRNGGLGAGGEMVVGPENTAATPLLDGTIGEL